MTRDPPPRDGHDPLPPLDAAPTHHPEEPQHVSFEALIEKVRQAEIALEAKERQATANWRQAKGSWRAAWTPGRIVVAGLASGFLFGRAEPFKKAAGGGTLQLISALGSLLAGDKAREAAQDADHAADAAEDAQANARAQAAVAPRAPVADVPAPGAPATDDADPSADAAPPADARAERERARRQQRAQAAADGRKPYELPETFRDSGHL